jgi:hypothetical protein
VSKNNRKDRNDLERGKLEGREKEGKGPGLQEPHKKELC